MSPYYIRPIPLHRGPRDKSQWTYLTDPGKRSGSCNYVWYIEGSQPKILIDAGSTAEPLIAEGKKEENIQSLEEGLSKCGLKPEDIDIVIMTHLHQDHVALAYKFSRAKFIVQRAELDFALSPHVMVAGGFDKKQFEGLNIEVVEGDKKIIEGVHVLYTPGHSPGGQSVAIETTKGTVIVTGFCCTLENFNPPPGRLPVVAPGIHTNSLQAYDSALKVKQMADIIVPLHDCSFINVNRIP